MAHDAAMTSHRERALNHIEAVQAHSAALDDLYSSPERVAPHLVGKAHDKLRQSVKLAQVHALLYIGDQVAAVVKRLPQ